MRNVPAMLLVSVLFPAFLFAQPSDRRELVERYAKELGSRDVWTRVEAAEALWIASEVAQPAIPALRKALDDPEPAVAVRAAGALHLPPSPRREREDADQPRLPIRNSRRRQDRLRCVLPLPLGEGDRG